MSQYANEYKQFLESPAGLQFMEVIHTGLDENHRRAESEPDKAGYYASTAKAYRGILNHITSVIGEKVK